MAEPILPDDDAIRQGYLPPEAGDDDGRPAAAAEPPPAGAATTDKKPLNNCTVCHTELMGRTALMCTICDDHNTLKCPTCHHPTGRQVHKFWKDGGEVCPRCGDTRWVRREPLAVPPCRIIEIAERAKGV
jgi:hypothetical protein